ncbi:hypothetical protein N0V93_000245 [Gnomoniopsis smithogilvyi]|uniref:Dirigent protein n=1 Tax=Gnomoniopsis smithogilvyi TaxID=1191159 RepID=A0A9W8Z3B9_9PEZI|nr:hypothetical protein N0V93_000245 [Gnomoniopsis smithogilvyi]
MLSILVSVLVLPFAGVFAKPEQIRAVQDPIFHYYLQSYPGNASLAAMGPESTSEYFNISGSIQSTNTSLFLNIGSDSTSYKTLTLGTTATMSGWALEGDTIITAQTSNYGRRK